MPSRRTGMHNKCTHCDTHVGNGKLYKHVSTCTYMMTSGKHRRPFEGRHLVNFAKSWLSLLSICFCHRSEEGCRNILDGVRRYVDKSAAVQHEEEKLLSKLRELSGHHADLNTAMLAFEKLLPEVRLKMLYIQFFFRCHFC